MEYMSIENVLSGRTGDEVKIRGWIYRIRSSGGIVFAVIRDATGIIQTTIKKGAVPDEQFSAAEGALVESSIIVSGTIKEDRRAPGGVEIQAKNVKIVHRAENFPVTKDQSEDFLLDIRHLWLRSKKQNAVMKIKAAVLMAAREWFDMNDFYEVTPPIITPNACEGGSTLFAFDYFGNEVYLSQSAQMYLEAIMFSLERVYSLTPSFRAEKSRTPRHITEFWHLEGEEAWVDNEGNMKIQEDLISHICQSVAKSRRNEFEVLGRNIEPIKQVEPPFERISYTTAIQKLQDMGFDIRWGDDFGAPEERALSQERKKPFFIVNFPKECKAFYMKENPEDTRTYLCSDLIAPEGYGEIIGASERETSAEKLEERLRAEGANIKNYEWYLDLRRYGSVPHSGFGLGIERLVMWLCKLEHIRDAIPFPRTPSRFYP